MPVANVRSKWSAGNLIFYESIAGNNAFVQFGEDGSGMDMKFFGSTASNYLLWDESADSLLLVGTAVKFQLGSFTGAAIGTGSIVSATTTAPFKVFADDGGLAIGSGSLVRAGWFRNLQTYTGGNREQESTGVQGSLVSVAGTNRHNMSGVLGSYEARTSLTVDGQAATTDTWIQAGVLGRVGSATNVIAIASNGVLAGVAAMSSVATQLASNSGIFAGFYAGAWSGMETWTHGLYIQAGAVDQGINVGAHSSATQGYGVSISVAKSAANRFYADDAGVVIATSSVPDVKNTLFRTLITADNSAYNLRLHSLMGQLKSVNGEWGDEQVSAVHGYLELTQTGGTITLQSYGVTAGVMATVETQGAFGVAVTHNLAGFAAVSKLGYSGTFTDNTNTSGLYVGIYDSTNWSDSPTLDKWNHGLYVQAAAVDKGIQIGELSSVAQTGLTFVAATGTSALDVFTDDGNVALTGGTPFKGIRSRTMFFQDQIGATTVMGILGQLKYYSGVDIGPARVAAVEGYNELLTTNIVKSGGEITSVNAVIDVVAGVFTVNSTGIATGFHAKLTGAGEAVQDTGGYLAGLKIDSDITTGQWGYGIYIQAGAVAKAIVVGALSSDTPGSGVALTDSVTRVMEVHADDNDTERASPSTQGRAIWGRTMIYANTTQENWGIDGLLKWSTVAHTGNVNAGVVGRFEAIGTNSTATGSGNTFVAGVMGRVGIASNAFTLGAGTFAVGVLAFYNTLTANNPATGYTAAFMATASDIALTGDWDYGLYIEDAANGIYLTTTTQAHEMVVSALPANARGARYAFTCATPAMSDGYGAHEIDLTVGAAATGFTIASSCWINAGDAATIKNYAWVHNDGVWLGNSATATDATIAWTRVHFVFGTNTSYNNLHLFDLNLDIDQNMTSLINCNNIALVGFTSGTHSSAVTGSIPFIGTGGTVKYIRVYDTAA